MSLPSAPRSHYAVLVTTIARLLFKKTPCHPCIEQYIHRTKAFILECKIWLWTELLSAVVIAVSDHLLVQTSNSDTLTHHISSMIFVLLIEIVLRITNHQQQNASLPSPRKEKIRGRGKNL